MHRAEADSTFESERARRSSRTLRSRENEIDFDYSDFIEVMDIALSPRRRSTAVDEVIERAFSLGGKITAHKCG